MKKYLIGFSVLTLFSAAAYAREDMARAADDYSSCVPLPGMGSIPYMIGPDGHLSVNPEAAGVKSVKKSDDKDVLVQVLPFQPFGVKDKMARKMVTTYTLNREGDRAVSMELKYSGNYAYLPPGAKETYPDTYVTEFRFAGKKCMVDKIYMKNSKDPGAKPKVTFDRNLCSDVMNQIKAMGREKARECFAEVGKMHASIQKHRKRLETDGYELAPFGFGGTFGNELPPDNGMQEHLNLYLLIGQCSMSAAVYDKEKVDPAMGFGFGFSGMGGGLPSPARDEKGGNTAQ